jgi:hypothetical protein
MAGASAGSTHVERGDKGTDRLPERHGDDQPVETKKGAATGAGPSGSDGFAAAHRVAGEPALVGVKVQAPPSCEICT